jgi:hypothetical protein
MGRRAWPQVLRVIDDTLPSFARCDITVAIMAFLS